jgi:hypothetical protein
MVNTSIMEILIIIGVVAVPCVSILVIGGIVALVIVLLRRKR